LSAHEGPPHNTNSYRVIPERHPGREHRHLGRLPGWPKWGDRMARSKPPEDFQNRTGFKTGL